MYYTYIWHKVTIYICEYFGPLLTYLALGMVSVLPSQDLEQMEMTADCDYESAG
jgi:hypothetical protein